MTTLTVSGERYLPLTALGEAIGGTLREDGEQLLDAPGGPWVRVAYLEWQFPELLARALQEQAPASVPPVSLPQAAPSQTCVPWGTAPGAERLLAAGFLRVTPKGAGAPCWSPPGTGRLCTEEEALRLLGGPGGPPSDCPACGRPMERGRICWGCNFRRCSCGRDTGSAFIGMCLQCQGREDCRE